MARDKKTKKAAASKAASKAKRKDKRTGDSQRRTWFFTSYRPLEDPPKYDADKVAYLVYQRESGNEEHREHWQGYIRFHDACRLKVAQTYIGENAHCEPPRFSEPVCRAYCTKEDTRVAGPYEFGKYRPVVGQESCKSAQAFARIREGCSLEDLEEQFPTLAIPFHNIFKDMIHERDMKKNLPLRKVKVVVLHGPGGVGKSTRVWNFLNGKSFCAVGDQPGAFDEYRGESIIFFDEFEPSDWKQKDLNRLLDGFPRPVHRRGSNLYRQQWDTVYITAQDPPHLWYPYLNEKHRTAFLRRFTEVIEVTDLAQEVRL